MCLPLRIIRSLLLSIILCGALVTSYHSSRSVSQACKTHNECSCTQTRKDKVEINCSNLFWHPTIPKLPELKKSRKSLPVIQLVARSNNITRIHKYAFVNHRFLTVIDLSDNRIHRINPEAFKGAGQYLRILKLKNNRIKHLSTRVLTDVAKLSYLELTGNRVRKMDGFCKSQMQFLDYLEIRDNSITRIPSQCFKNKRNVTYLDFANNQIKRIGRKTFKGLEKKLAFLDLSNNRITFLADIALQTFIQLKELRLSNNFIKSVKFICQATLPNLLYLHLDRNEIDRVPRQCFQNSPTAYGKLSSLQLNDNKLQDMAFACNTAMKYLRNLVLGNNTITTIPPLCFRYKYVLETLLLNSNDISKVGFDVGLSHTRLNHLDLSHNSLSHIGTLFLQGVSQLRFLLLPGNRLVSIEFVCNGIKSRTWRSPQTLKVDARWNQISYVSKGCWRTLQKNGISLTGNPFAEHRA